MLGRTGISAEVDVVVDGSVSYASMEEFILPMQIHGQIGGRVEVVFPTEVVGIVFRFEPGGRLSFQVDVKAKSSVFKAVAVFPEALFPLTSKVKIADLVAQCDQLGMSADGGHPEKVHDDATMKDYLGVLSVNKCTILYIIIVFNPIKTIINSSIQVKRYVIVIPLITQCIPSEAVPEGVKDGGVGSASAEHRIVGCIERQGCGGLVIE